MKLQATQENLARALSTVARVASGRNTLPILSNVLLKTTDNRLSVAATNLDIAINHLIGCKIGEEGAITVPARLTQEFISSLPGGVVDIVLDDHKLKINTDQYESTINGIDAEEFPVMPQVSDGSSLTMPSTVLKNALTQVILAASKDEARPTLTGIYFQERQGKLYMAATDSYRLAEKVLSVKAAEGTRLLVPATAMQEVLRILSDSEDEVEMVYNEQQVLFRIGDVELVARLIEGNYPNYHQLMPAKFEKSATLPRAEFINITKVSSLFARESAGSVTIKISQNDGQVSIRSIASQLGENNASASAKVKGDGEITLNSRYLLDALNVMNGEDVTFSFNGKLEPSQLKSSSQDDYTHIIMPLKS